MLFLLMSVLLLGCSAEPVFEPVEDVYGGTLREPGTLQVMVPEKAAMLTSVGDSGQLYFCDGYTLTVQTLSGGDLDRSFRSVTGYGKDVLTVLETLRQGVPCYSCAWTSTGETGDQVGRMVLLDDGVYHYTVTVMADADRAGELSEVWDQILNRVTLSNTGS